MLAIDLTGKRALITGGARGIGPGIVRAFAAAGAALAIGYGESGSAANALAAEVTGSGGRAVALPADLRRPAEATALVGEAVAALGGLDILVHSAGITSRRSFKDLEADEFERVLSVNLRSAFALAKAAAPVMEAGGWGRILLLSSTGAITGGGGGAHYAASKAALTGLMRALARELAPRGITVNVVMPTVIDTDFLVGLYPDPAARAKLADGVPVGRLGQPADVGNLAAFLASDLASFINGQAIVVDGGRTFK